LDVLSSQIERIINVSEESHDHPSLALPLLPGHSEGKQRYRCRECLEGRGRTFLLDYSYAGQSPEVKEQIVDMAMKASGMRDTARVLHVSPTPVINELKKGTCAPTGESRAVSNLEP
jgi:hypothetical protein